ncbi:MAG: tripartite tricarboxylate transporter permease [Deltaproteobacteria bacterium]|nr:tripartite tricarboxylate transporter permease [Deltaproteobacteria bacterium]
MGTQVGVLPGLGPVAAISLLLPATFHVPPVSSIIMLSGIYYGAMYGGSITSILVNIPGEAASVVTCFDGYQIARKGRAGPGRPSMLKSLMMACIGVVIGNIGLDLITAQPRFTFGLDILLDGVGLVPKD